ncbi:hypothetical protein TRAPUB_12549 [Trametes pubescens]|uniref:AAA+ ATPase domain-containing protein n=1 Tax=Trametes pubescens TaxID=154538 RepID=A0A1M2VTN3_TRAPU|nr:hypothetical protein TRAPUB_12549 [Trametes pubescens]
MHSVTIRRPDSVVGSEDSDQPDFRIVVDSPMASRASRIKSPPRSPRTNSLLLALGNIIQQDEEDGEWEEEESAEQESCSGDGGSEGRMSGEYAKPPSPPADVGDGDARGSLLFSAGDVDTPARPTPILGVGGDAMALLAELASPEDERRPHLLGSFISEDALEEDTTLAGDTTLLDAFSPRSASPIGETSIISEDETTVRLRRSIIPEFPLPSTRVPSPRRDSSSSGLLSPIEFTPAPPISLPRSTMISREESFDSGYADGPAPLALSPPRSPHRMSTFSLLSSPFGSPSARRVLRFDPTASSAAALFSPRFGAFPSTLDQEQDSNDHGSGVFRHSRGDSIDTLDSIHGIGPTVGAEVEHPIADDFTAEIEAHSSPSPSRTRHSSIPEGSSLFRALHSPVYSPVDEDSLRPGEPSFGEDDTMSSLYDQYYTPTIHTQLIPPPVAQEASPTPLVDSEPVAVEPTPVAGPSSAPLHTSSPRPSPPRSASVLSSSSRHSLSRPSSSAPRLSLRRSPQVPHVFSPPSSSGSAIGIAMLEQMPSPALSAGRPAWIHDEVTHVPAEGSTRSGSSMSSRADDSVGQLPSKKVPFGFRHSVSDRSQASVRSSFSGAPSRISRVRPPPLLNVGREPEKPKAVTISPFSPVEPPSATSSAGPGRLKPLRLSMILSSSSPLDSSIPSATNPPSLTTGTTATTTHTPSSPTVSSEYSLSNNRLLSSPRSSIIPHRTHNTQGSLSRFDSPLQIPPVISHSQPASAPVSRPPSWQQRFSKRRSLLVQPTNRLSYVSEQYARSESRLSEPIDESREEDEFDAYEAADRADETIRRPVSALSSTQPRPESVVVTPVHAIATPRPTLLFALASDDLAEVRRVLESGEARPNDDVGPQSALAFTLANGQLKNKVAMVKLLLAYGADASALRDAEADEGDSRSGKRGSRPMSKLLEEADPATRYYIERANSPQTRRTSALIHRSFFRPLTRVRYDLIGQDRVIEQLFRVLSMPSMAPIVVLLCGPSGHGKSLLGRKFGALLDVPTHTVNMTTLQDTRDIWKSHSIDPHEAPSDRSLKDFLMENEGKRCVVVLDEIEKVQDEKILSSLLMPWEYGRCSFEAGHRHVDVSKVIWLGTSNIGHDLVFEHQDSRPAPQTQLSREEYIDLMALLRPRVSDRLGASLLSRVTVVLPFVAFTAEEKLAIAAEALYALAGEGAATMPPATREKIVRSSLDSYIPSEGARSLYRAVSSQLLDTI